MSKQRQKGTLAETALVQYLQDNGYPQAERRALHGTADKGDVLWLPWLAVEVKNHRTPKYRDWLRQAEEERVNAGADVGVVIHKPHGVGTGSQGEWHVVMTLDQFRALVERDR